MNVAWHVPYRQPEPSETVATEVRETEAPALGPSSVRLNELFVTESWDGYPSPWYVGIVERWGQVRVCASRTRGRRHRSNLDDRAVDPLGVASAAHQEPEGLGARLHVEHAGAGILDRDERRTAYAAGEFVRRGLVFQGNCQFRHLSSVVRGAP